MTSPSEAPCIFGKNQKNDKKISQVSAINWFDLERHETATSIPTQVTSPLLCLDSVMRLWLTACDSLIMDHAMEYACVTWWAGFEETCYVWWIISLGRGFNKFHHNSQHLSKVQHYKSCVSSLSDGVQCETLRRSGINLFKADNFNSVLCAISSTNSNLSHWIMGESPLLYADFTNQAWLEIMPLLNRAAWMRTVFSRSESAKSIGAMSMEYTSQTE